MSPPVPPRRSERTSKGIAQPMYVPETGLASHVEKPTKPKKRNVALEALDHIELESSSSIMGTNTRKRKKLNASDKLKDSQAKSKKKVAPELQEPVKTDLPDGADFGLPSPLTNPTLDDQNKEVKEDKEEEKKDKEDEEDQEEDEKEKEHDSELEEEDGEDTDNDSPVKPTNRVKSEKLEKASTSELLCHIFMSYLS